MAISPIGSLGGSRHSGVGVHEEYQALLSMQLRERRREREQARDQKGRPAPPAKPAKTLTAIPREVVSATPRDDDGPRESPGVLC
ncbi:hypothetical protein [Quadrisphaera granulorum]|uniref:hypothetical protein n=1 Tax=Quadrisphaera granulorum TaxID=317664 RepID=UPI0011B6A2AC|nr:hypothetical protein [Quadrisphaera granulorum]